MTQLTIRGLGKDLERRIRELADSEGMSLNQATLKLLRKATGLDGGTTAPRSDCVGSGLDHHIGTWTDEEASELLASVADFEVVDQEMWK